MKKKCTLVLLLVLSFVAVGQMGTVSDVAIVDAVCRGDNDRIKVLPHRQLVAGQGNVVKFSVENIRDNQLIVKPLSEEVCAFRRGEQAGEYVFTPKVASGTVVVRVGHMDMLGAYMNIGNVELTIVASEPAASDTVPDGDTVLVD